MKKLLASALALFASCIAFAQSGSGPAQPQPGMWWNPAESGRGWSIDAQGDLMTVTTFAYDSAGNMQWYYSTGPLQNGGYLWRGELLKINFGQPLNGAYRSPAVVGSDGFLTLEFTSRVTGFATLPGGRRIPIERQNFGVGAPPGALRGQWFFVYKIGTSFFVDVYNLTTIIGPTPGGNGIVTDGSTRVGFEYQTSGTLAGLVVGFRFDASGNPIDQYLFQLQMEEGRGSWVSPTTFNEYGMSVYKSHTPSGMAKAGGDADLAAREGKTVPVQAKGASIDALEARSPEAGAIARRMWGALQQQPEAR